MNNERAAVLGLGSWVLGHGSWVMGHGSWVLGLGSCVLGKLRLKSDGKSSIQYENKQRTAKRISRLRRGLYLLCAVFIGALRKEQ